jgi:hypothetical protein
MTIIEGEVHLILGINPIFMPKCRFLTLVIQFLIDLCLMFGPELVFWDILAIWRGI